MKILILLTLITLPALAYYNPYETRGNRVPICDDTYLELTNLPPIREQGSIGICYSFSSLLLLEHLKCSKTEDPEKCYQSNRGSAVDLTKFMKGKSKNLISIGGDPQYVLRNFAENRSLVNDACTYFDKWARLPYSSGYEDFFHVLKEDLKSNNQAAIACHAQDMASQNMGNVNQLLSLMETSRELSVEKLRSQFLYNKSCQEPNITFPAYDMHRYPEYGGSATRAGIFKFIKANLEKQSPVEISFCAEKDDQGQCYYHSTTVVGMRNICDQTGCNVQYRIQNSYGKSWQDNHDDGWVNADLISQSVIDTPQISLTSISPKGQTPKTQSPYLQHQKVPFKMAAKTSLSSQNRFGASQCYVELPGMDL